ncbi:hypothetical protein C0991_005976 [Blastosporella zonata]|nr:hypothetical protein C0991_005976 [Blastosporella zonata]
MDAPAPSQPPSSAAGSSTNWARSGEPGSTFSGLSRGGRGRGSGRGRGGRGGRGGPREIKPGDDSTTDKPNITSTSKSTATPIAKPVSLPAPSASEKTAPASTVPAAVRPKGNPRRASRSNPPAVVLPVSADTANNPNASRSSNRRRRSQSGKPAPTLAKINVPSHDDNLLRPQRPRMGSVPHTAPIKDAPPHLPGSPFQKRADIDALVERVRAVAMDNRPNTPGSHIDWAGSDDDSLPDLEDWGIPSTKVVKNENGLISPLAVSGLRPLPGVTIDGEISPPHPKSPSSDASNQPDTAPLEIEAPDNIIPNPDDTHVATPITTTQEPLVSAPGSAKVSLHLALPTDTAEVEGTVAHEEKEQLGALIERGLAASIHSPNARVEHEDPFSALRTRNGLAASIHAPQPNGISETKSAPSNISSYSTASPEYRTHNRSQTIGRPPLYNNGRPSRSGYDSPRSGLSVGGGHHARTHSTPPSGTHNPRSPAHRPVITGDAISRLARTIGNTNLSPKAPTVGATVE